METIKNILSGNKNDENLATDQTTGTSGVHSGTGQTSGLTSGTTANQGLTGEGSHLAGHRDNLDSTNTTNQNTTSSGLGNTQNMTSSGLGSNQNTTSSGLGNNQNTTSSGLGNSRNTTSSGLGNNQNTTSSGLGNNQNTGLSSGTAGPHTSNIANKADPRVDSDLDGSRTAGGAGNTTSTGYGTSNTTDTTTGNTGFSGPHRTEAANRLDPSVNTSSGVGLESAQHHSTTHGGGAEEADRHHSSHVGRDAAGGAGGVGLAEHEHHKHQNERGTGTGGTTGFSTGAYDNTTSSTGHQSSHLGRDAAVIGGGAGLADHEHHKHQNERGTGIGGTTGSSTGAYDNTTGSSTGAYDNTTSSTGHQSSHLGRDAAVVGGGAGLAEHEHRKHQNERDSGIGGTSSTTGTGNISTAGAGQSHLGRDAAVGAAGVGAASSLPGPAPHTAGPHKQDWLNELDPRVNAHPEQPQSTGHGPLKVTEGQTGTAKPYDPTTGYVSNPHHHGVSDVNPDGSTSRHANPSHHGQSRANDLPGHDAAAVGAVGGAGAYEAGKQHHGTESGVGGTSSSTTAGPHSSNIANKADPTVDSDRSKDHHYGRDAGLAGGTGAAAYEADKHHQKHDKDLTAAEREAKKEHKHELKEEKRELKEEKREHKESKGGLLSFLHRDTNKKYTKEEEAEFDRQEREHNSHKGRDALGGAALGGAAYEADKHHRDNKQASGVVGNTNKALPAAPGNHGIGTGAGTQNALAGDNTTSTSSGHHLGRDAAAVGGAGALGEHEHNKHSSATGSGVNATPLKQKPVGTDLGDKLHGVDRNRGVPGSTGFPDSGTGSSTTGTTSTGRTSTGQHHYGRDATAVGGAAALGEHERRKHDNENVGSAGYGNQSSGIADSSTGSGNQHHLGRDAAVGAGDVGLAEHEHRKHEGTTGSGYNNTSSGLTRGNQYDNTSSGLIGGQSSSQDPKYGSAGYNSSKTGVQSETGERNRLHKDPPANHPAAQGTQGGVPASGSERENLIGQGEQRLNDDTGVANAHGRGGVNAASNY